MFRLESTTLSNSPLPPKYCLIVTEPNGPSVIRKAGQPLFAPNHGPSETVAYTIATRTLKFLNAMLKFDR